MKRYFSTRIVMKLSHAFFSFCWHARDKNYDEVWYQGIEDNVSKHSEDHNSKWTGFPSVFYITVLWCWFLVYSISKTWDCIAHRTFGNGKNMSQFISVSKSTPLSCRTVGSIKKYLSRNGSLFLLWFRQLHSTTNSTLLDRTLHVSLSKLCNLKHDLQTDDL